MATSEGGDCHGNENAPLTQQVLIARETPNTMIDISEPSPLAPQSDEERFVNIISRGTGSGTVNKYACKFCNLQFIGGPSKIRAHFGCSSTQRSGKCAVIPPEKLNEFKAFPTVKQDLESTKGA